MEKGRQVYCPLCGRLQSIENTEKIVRCIYCGKEFTAEDAVKNHMETINSCALVYASPEIMFGENSPNKKKRNIKEKFAFLNKKNKHNLRKEEETKPYPDNFI